MSESTTRQCALLLLAAIYLPILGPILPMLSALPTNLINYGTLLAVSAAGLAVMKKRRPVRRTVATALFAAFLGYLFVVLTFKLLLSPGELRTTIQLYRLHVAGIVYAFSSLVVVQRLPDLRMAGRFLVVFAGGLSILVLIQGGLSFMESVQGVLLGDYTTELASELGRRDLVSEVGYRPLQASGLRLAFTGLMGQHNRFGSLLVLCNLVFLARFLWARNLSYVVMLVVVLVLAILNTTRTSILAIVVTDLMMLPLLIPGFRWLRPVLVAGILVAGGWLLRERLAPALVSTGALTSWVFRVEFWAYSIREYAYFSSSNPFTFTFGPGFESMRNISMAFSSVQARSFESEFLAMLFRGGVLGSVAYGLLLCGLGLQGLRLREQARWYLWALLASVVVTSLTLDLNLRFHNAPLLVIAWYLGAFALNHDAIPEAPPSRSDQFPNDGTQ